MTLFGLGRRHDVRRWWHSPKLVVAWLCGWWLVDTIDMDGEVRLRRLYLDADGRWCCRRISGWCYLNPDGTVTDGAYVERWRPFFAGRRVSPLSVGAVDPVGGTGTERPRAHESSSKTEIT